MSKTVCCPDCLHIAKPLDYEEAKCNDCGLIWTWQDCDVWGTDE